MNFCTVLKSTCNYVIINTEVRGFNLLKHPVAERQRTLKTKLRGFSRVVLLEVKSLSNKYQNNQNFRFETVPSGSRERASEMERKLGDRTEWH